MVAEKAKNRELINNLNNKRNTSSLMPTSMSTSTAASQVKKVTVFVDVERKPLLYRGSPKGQFGARAQLRTSYFCFDRQGTSPGPVEVVAKWHSVFAGLERTNCFRQGLGAGLQWQNKAKNTEQLF